MKATLKRLFNKYWRFIFAGYVFIYLPCFYAIEHKITPDYPGIHILNGPIDDCIPFIEVFIIPYVLWFLYVVVACIFMLWSSDDGEFLRFALSLVIGMTLFLVISVIYPNELTLRPDHVSDSILGRVISYLYVTDTATNVFPSIHVYNSLAVNIALCKCNALKNHRLIKLESTILCILICLSTVFLKQHSVIDVVGAVIMMAVIYVVLYVVDYNKLWNRDAQSEHVEQAADIKY